MGQLITTILQGEYIDPKLVSSSFCFDLEEKLGEDFFSLDKIEQKEKLNSLLDSPRLLARYPVAISLFLHALSRKGMQGIEVSEQFDYLSLSTPAVMQFIYSGRDVSSAENKLAFLQKSVRLTQLLATLKHFYATSQDPYSLEKEDELFSLDSPFFAGIPSEVLRRNVREEIRSALDLFRARFEIEKEKGFLPTTVIPESLQARYFLENISNYVNMLPDIANKHPLVIKLADLIGIDFFYLPSPEWIPRLEQVYLKRGVELLLVFLQLKNLTGRFFTSYLGILGTEKLSEEGMHYLFLKNMSTYMGYRGEIVDEVKNNPLVTQLSEMLGVNFFSLSFTERKDRFREVYNDDEKKDALVNLMLSLKETRRVSFSDWLNIRGMADDLRAAFAKTTFSTALPPLSLLVELLGRDFLYLPPVARIAILEEVYSDLEKGPQLVKICSELEKLSGKGFMNRIITMPRNKILSLEEHRILFFEKLSRMGIKSADLSREPSVIQLIEQLRIDFFSLNHTKQKDRLLNAIAKDHFVLSQAMTGLDNLMDAPPNFFDRLVAELEAPVIFDNLKTFFEKTRFFAALSGINAMSSSSSSSSLSEENLDTKMSETNSSDSLDSLLVRTPVQAEESAEEKSVSALKHQGLFSNTQEEHNQPSPKKQQPS